MKSYYTVLAFLPILVLLVISVGKGVKAGVLVSLVVTVLLFFLWKGTVSAFFASLIVALTGTITILMIVAGAIFLYTVMKEKGFIARITRSLEGIHPDKNFRFCFLALFMTMFFESVAGFGTPGAIIPLILVSMGYSPVLSISVVLLVNGICAISGAIGTPVSAGLATPLALDVAAIPKIYFYSASAIFLAATVVFFFIRRFMIAEGHNTSSGSAWIMLFFLTIPLLLLSAVLQELIGLISAVIMALCSFLLLFKNRRIDGSPWLPYVMLIVLLLLPRIFSGLAEFLEYRVTFENLMGTSISASLQPLKSPLIPFLITGVFALFLVRNFRVDLKPVGSGIGNVFIILFPSLVITQLMLNSGGTFPSMVETIAAVFVKSGDFYPLFSPLTGVLGAFISGSTTVSNIIFGSAQLATAEDLSLNPLLILGLQNSGASLGNAICLFNIIAAAAVAGVNDYRSLLKMNLLPVILGALACSLVGYFFILTGL